ncbi:alpha/beta fold hydrolase [Novosphingobium sp. 9]|uniref:alpha/beta fold hydrolase n=1 Tax=Novosphingobium sp. 9 TaxID=2025349 RepID=UPI0021B4DB60|nr:alpha/beta hydrolase [Novosphingobium sp. 9]
MTDETASSSDPQTVILLPGLLCDAAIWTDQVAALAPCYRVMVLDPGERASITQMAERVLAEGPLRFSLAGHSMGARVAMEVARLAPHRIARLALLDTGAHPVRSGEAEKRQVMLDISAGQGMRALADAWLPPMVGEARFAEDEALRETLYAMVERMTPAIHRAQIAALLARPDAMAGLAALRDMGSCPALIGVGRDDRWSPPEQHEAIVAALPEARFVIFEGAGHMAPLEAPDAVSAALLAWMAMPIKAGPIKTGPIKEVSAPETSVSQTDGATVR